MSLVMDGLKEFIPVKRMAVLYTPGENNSEIQLMSLQVLKKTYDIKVIPVPLSSREEISQIMPAVIRNADALYVTGSNVIYNNSPMIVDMANRAHVATVTHLDDLVKKGVLLGVCTSSYLLGRRAGNKAVKILRGAKPSSLPIDRTTQFEYHLNMKTAKEGHFRISPQLMKKINRFIE